MYYKRWYYERQGIPYAKGMVPVFGHLLRYDKVMKKYNDYQHPWIHVFEEDFGKKIPKIYGICNNFEPVLHIRDPDMLQEIYVTKNKYFDKHPYLKGIFFPLLGESTLFEASNQSWAAKRKVLSTAFYKEKLTKMVVLIKEEVRKSLAHWKDTYVTAQ